MSDYTIVQDIHGMVGDVPPDSILSRTVSDVEDGRVVLFAFAPGQMLSEHTSSHAAILYFLTGEAALTLGEDEHLASAGTLVHMAPHLPHSVVARTHVTLLLILLK